MRLPVAVIVAALAGAACHEEPAGPQPATQLERKPPPPPPVPPPAAAAPAAPAAPAAAEAKAPPEADFREQRTRIDNSGYPVRHDPARTIQVTKPPETKKGP